MRVGIMLPNWVGDLAMATPMLRALHTGLGESAQLIGIMKPYLRGVLEGTPWLSQVVPYEHKKQFLRNSLALAKTLRPMKLDAMLLCRPTFRAAIVSRFCGAKRVIAYGRFPHTWLLDEALEMPMIGGKMKPVSCVDSYLGLAEKLGCTTTNRQLELATTATDESLTNEVWQRLALPPGEQTVVLNTFGAFGESKHWPREHTVNLAKRLASELGLGVVIHCGPAERDEARAIEQAVDHRLVRSLADEPKLPFGLSKAIIRRSRLLVTTDSGPRHLASGVGTPVVVLFGPIDPRWSDNYQTDVTSLRLTLDCSPCGKPRCPLGHGNCMRDLTVGMVFDAVRKQLARASAAA
jgi:heptosyltransferase II